MSLIPNRTIFSRELQIVIDSCGMITEITSNCYDILGYTDVEMLDTNICKYLKYTFDDLVHIESTNAEILSKDGIKIFFDISSNHIRNNDNKHYLVHLSLIDISKYKESKNREEMLFRMFSHAKDLICRLELIPEVKFTYLSPSVEDILGYSLEEYKKNPMLPFEIIHPDDREIQLSKVDRKTDFSKLFQARFRHKKGHYLWLEDYIIPYYNKEGQLVAVETITRNIQEKKELEIRLEKLGYHDNLTALFNKNYMLKEIDLLNNKINVPVGILACDLDKLKYINDSLGHSKGDILIKNTAKLLLSTFNSNHIVVRAGGDEFVVIMMDISCHEANGLCSEFQVAINHHNDGNRDMPIHISMGRAYSETSLNVMQHTLDIADSNMYKNKRQKKHVQYLMGQAN
ncbi:diguanylate cyclase domain-containing protein [Clostridium lacusfryxellense]|uniref:diguanylate cyclase domain-containing protein n=1 Tax=Clostridium lacusfryxellense TaxID=205328 RepID=UPI001C0D22E0|nr:diguanylate cyclase [Clostridium lacusfryxellense]MBU3111665.1 sensor domain-containing diguanylate cyclase [Clostridium lacusfryxellense]